MGIYWYAMNYESMTYFEAPSKFGYNKAEHVHNPNNLFPHMLVYMNEKEDSLYYPYELKCDQYHDILKGNKWNDFKNITEDVYKEYLEFWKETGLINNGLFDDLLKNESE